MECQDWPSLHVLGVLGAGLAAVDGGLGAPLLGQAADAAVDVLVEAQQVADDPAVQNPTTLEM